MTQQPENLRNTIGKKGVILAVMVVVMASHGAAYARNLSGKTLRIALASEIISADPHRHVYTPDILLLSHIYDTLVAQDQDERLAPSLAVKWAQPTPNTWDFTLKKDARFHDGSPLRAHDVASSIQRARSVRDSPVSFGDYLSAIVRTEILSPHVLRIHTTDPIPDLPYRLSILKIIPTKAVLASRADFDQLLQKTGSGPYQLQQFDRQKQEIILRASSNYHGPPPRWDTVVLRVIPDDALRVTALIAGHVDIIEQLPPADASRLVRNPAYTVTSLKPDQLLFLAPDTRKRHSPFVLETGKRQTNKNPMHDPRVRRAISLAIDRQALTEDSLCGFAEPTDSPLLSSIRPTHLRPEPERARKLLRDAGWEGGFTVTLHIPEDRYASALEIANTVALQLSRIGVTVVIEPVDPELFYRAAGNGEYSLMLLGIALDIRTPMHPLSSLLGSTQKMNRTGWQNARMDRLLAAAAEMENAGERGARERGARLAEIQAILDAEAPIMPLYRQVPLYAMRAHLSMNNTEPRGNLADTITPLPSPSRTVSDAGH
ncbi:hypothetical protein HEQ60_03095 [Haematospirillum sp. H1815]|uniref:ABC transporter substrate-binding protein n=1 Tax=Haematospirillum sp. H1815 TaxID=2723108 RepID=UPI00143A70F8|nr:ABC transporter substrate-binding protein [Haematospirillum sp. H1815]NKD76754.1 hypothetical protein [Haematospirillum sp. H1815]